MRSQLLLICALLLAAGAPALSQDEQARRVLGSEHLRVLYWPEHEALAEVAEDAGIIAINRLRRMLDVEPQQRIDVFIVRSQAEFDALSGGPSRHSVVGRAITGKLRVVVKPMGRQRLPDLIAHELAHIMLDMRMGEKAHMLTRWLHEGIAQYAEGGIDENQRRIIARAAIADELLTLDELDAAFGGDSQQIALAYAQSYTLVEYLSDISPGEGIAPLLDQLSKGHDIRLAMGLAFGRAVPVMEEEWLQGLRHRYFGHFGVPFYEGLVGVLFIVALAIAMIYVRRRSMRIRRRMEQEERLRELYGTIPAGPYTPLQWVDERDGDEEPPDDPSGDEHERRVPFIE